MAGAGTVASNKTFNPCDRAMFPKIIFGIYGCDRCTRRELESSRESALGGGIRRFTLELQVGGIDGWYATTLVQLCSDEKEKKAEEAEQAWFVLSIVVGGGDWK